MRRQRFTATVSRGGQPERRVILAYGASGVRAHFERLGYVVVGVTRGDYRRRQRAAQTVSAPGFRIDHAAIREAADLLGVEWPIEVVTNGRHGNQRGNHQLRYRGGSVRLQGMRYYNLDTATDVYHRICVKSYLSAEQAGRTLWHELTHAMQAEREAREVGAGSMWDIHHAWAGCSARGRGTAYRAKPIEVEAREHEALNDDLKLAGEKA